MKTTTVTLEEQQEPQQLTSSADGTGAVAGGCSDATATGNTVTSSSVMSIDSQTLFPLSSPPKDKSKLSVVSVHLLCIMHKNLVPLFDAFMETLRRNIKIPWYVISTKLLIEIKKKSDKNLFFRVMLPMVFQNVNPVVLWRYWMVIAEWAPRKTTVINYLGKMLLSVMFDGVLWEGYSFLDLIFASNQQLLLDWFDFKQSEVLGIAISLVTFDVLDRYKKYLLTSDILTNLPAFILGSLQWVFALCIYFKFIVTSRFLFYL